jgi:Methyltransferase domain
MGESYFAFCQAIVEFDVQCKAFAVDTWRGDIHTGAYGEEVFSEIEQMNQKYAGFSCLLRMTFDEASARFPDNSIDLLHIDGAHTYDAVRHDFDTWRPKVKTGGIVIMHDSFDRHDDFGVWKLLEELRSEVPVAEFVHSHGLGVILKPGGASSENVATAFVNGSDELRNRMRRYYQVCADHLQLEFLARRRSSEWDVTSQLFWRTDATEFTEAASVRAVQVVGTEAAQISLPIPRANPRRYHEFQVALTLVPAMIELLSLAIVDEHNELLWKKQAADGFREWSGTGLDGIITEDGAGVLVLDTPQGSHFRLKPPAHVLERLAESGGKLNIEMRGVDPHGFASRISKACRTNFGQRRSGLWPFGRSRVAAK